MRCAPTLISPKRSLITQEMGPRRPIADVEAARCLGWCQGACKKSQQVPVEKPLPVAPLSAAAGALPLLCTAWAGRHVAYPTKLSRQVPLILLRFHPTRHCPRFLLLAKQNFV